MILLLLLFELLKQLLLLMTWPPRSPVWYIFMWNVWQRILTMSSDRFCADVSSSRFASIDACICTSDRIMKECRVKCEDCRWSDFLPCLIVCSLGADGYTASRGSVCKKIRSDCGWGMRDECLCLGRVRESKSNLGMALPEDSEPLKPLLEAEIRPSRRRWMH